MDMSTFTGLRLQVKSNPRVFIIGLDSCRKRRIGHLIYHYNPLGRRVLRYADTKEKARRFLDLERWPIGSWCRMPQLQYNKVMKLILKLKRKRGLDVESMNLCIRLIERIITEIAIPRQDRPSKRAKMKKWATDLVFFGDIWKSWKVLWYKATPADEQNAESLLLKPLELQDLLVRMNRTLRCFRYDCIAMEQIMDVLLHQKRNDRHDVPQMLENILDSMTQRADALYNPDLKPRTDTYNLVLHAYDISGRPDAEVKMQQIMEKMQTEPIAPQIPNSVTDLIWLRFYGEQLPLQLDKLERLLDEMDNNRKNNPRQKPPQKLLPHGLFGYYRRQGPIEMENPLQKYHDLLEAWSASRLPDDIDRMMEIVEYMHDDVPGEWNITPKIETYSILLRYWIDRKNLERVQDIRERATTRKISWNVEFCTELLEFYTQYHHENRRQNHLVATSSQDAPVSVRFLIQEMWKIVLNQSPRPKVKSKKKSGKHPNDNPAPKKIARRTKLEVEAIDYYQGWTILDTVVHIVSHYFELLEQQNRDNIRIDLSLIQRCLRYSGILFDVIKEMDFLTNIDLEDRMCQAMTELYAIAICQLDRVDGVQSTSIVLETSIDLDFDKISLLVRAYGLILKDVEAAEQVLQNYVARQESDNERCFEPISAFEAMVEVYARETLDKQVDNYMKTRKVFDVLNLHRNKQGEKLRPSVEMIENLSNIYYNGCVTPTHIKNTTAQVLVNQGKWKDVIDSAVDTTTVRLLSESTNVLINEENDDDFDYGSIFCRK